MRVLIKMRERMLFASYISAFLFSSGAFAGSISPLDPASCKKMQDAGVMSARPVAPCERLALVRFSYFGFDQQTHSDGEIVVLDAVAPYALNIFDELRNKRFPIAQARLMEHYGGDDDLSIAANNTSAYNDRIVANSNAISFHAYGVAIDVNPVQNPYISKATGEISPPSGADYAARRPLRPGMAESVIGVFSKFGFREWGGRWRTTPDYQHFQVDRAIARRLLAAPPEQAQALFQNYVNQGRRR